MKKKGFTLIELLAVIVILAIIALIATPLVLKYIEYSKEKSAKLSANTYAEAVEKEYVSKLTSNEKMPNKEYTIKELDELGVKVKGDKPKGDSDHVVLNNGNVIEYVLTINGYIIKYKDGNTTVGSGEDNGASNDNLLDHTVKFMVDGELYEVVSVKDGNSVNKPTQPTSSSGVFDSWHINGTKVTFPFVPTGDIKITALFYDGIDRLYTKYNVSKEEYPVILIKARNDGGDSEIFFLPSTNSYRPLEGYSNLLSVGGNYNYYQGNLHSYLTDINSIEAICEDILNNDSLTIYTQNAAISHDANNNIIYYTNDVLFNEATNINCQWILIK